MRVTDHNVSPAPAPSYAVKQYQKLLKPASVIGERVFSCLMQPHGIASKLNFIDGVYGACRM